MDLGNPILPPPLIDYGGKRAYSMNQVSASLAVAMRANDRDDRFANIPDGIHSQDGWRNLQTRHPQRGTEPMRRYLPVRTR